MTKNTCRGITHPILRKEMCDGCGLCTRVCPGVDLDYTTLNRLAFDDAHNDAWIGVMKGAYLAWSRDSDTRRDCSSGGLITEVLLYLLEKGLIDGAVVVGMNSEKPLESESYIARTREEVLAAAGSKYTPSSPNRELFKTIQGDKRHAIVGLPCQIAGIRKAESTIGKLNDRIVIRLGLFCSYSRTSLATEYALRQYNLAPDNVRMLRYRGGGWPGTTKVLMTNGGETRIPFPEFAKHMRAFVPWRCMLCNDQTSELADMSFGDAWLGELRNDVLGTSVVVCRTEKAVSLLNSMVQEGRIQITPLSREKVIESQHGLVTKKVDLGARIVLATLARRQVPKYRPRPRNSPSGSYFRAILFLIPWAFASNSNRWWLLDLHDRILLRFRGALNLLRGRTM